MTIERILTMISIIYLAVATLVGWYAVAPMSRIDAAGRRDVNLIWVYLAAAFGCGILLLTWPLYLLSWYLHTSFDIARPLTPANIIVMLAGLVFVFVRILRSQKKQRPIPSVSSLINDRKLFIKELIFYGLLLVFVYFTMRYVLYVNSDGKLCMGWTVFSDYAPHSSMIRSFSMGANYPTQYPHFGGEDVKYHFMFQFLVGNLEYLGMRFDIAYNIPSALGLTGFLMILSQMAIRLFKRFSALLLTVLFFFARSGIAVFLFFKEKYDEVHSLSGALKELIDQRGFIGYTPNENWGLFNYNVYLNQRHLGFTLIIGAFAVWFFMTHLEAFWEEKAEAAVADANSKSIPAGKKGKATGSPKKGKTPQTKKAAPVKESSFFEKLVKETKDAFKSFGKAWKQEFTAPGLKKENVIGAVLTGLFLGMCGFFNGAVVIGILIVLFGMAIFAKRKWEFVIAAAITLFLVLLQSNTFIDKSAFAFSLQRGFIAEQKPVLGEGIAAYFKSLFAGEWRGVYPYLFEITGITCLGIIVAVFFLKKTGKGLAVAFILPVIFAFTVSLTSDVTVNHKYIMIAIAFLGMLWAGLVSKLFTFKFKKKGARIAGKAGAVALAFFLCFNGIYDFYCVMMNNGDGHQAEYNYYADVTHYLANELTEKDLLLTPWYSVNEVTLSGVMMYVGWPYYAWSAGYDTDARSNTMAEIYTTTDPQRMTELLKGAGITYVLYETNMSFDNVTWEDITEDTAKQCLSLIYTSPDDDGRFRVYKVN